jgi:hypothetical protein
VKLPYRSAMLCLNANAVRCHTCVSGFAILPLGSSVVPAIATGKTVTHSASSCRSGPLYAMSLVTCHLSLVTCHLSLVAARHKYLTVSHGNSPLAYNTVLTCRSARLLLSLPSCRWAASRCMSACHTSRACCCTGHQRRARPCWHT